MSFDHDTLVWFSKTFGLFLLIGLFVMVIIYAYWPSNKKPFDRAASSILDEEDKPWQ
jgi:cytochrome c oxidase cbb3-type subunit 4